MNMPRYSSRPFPPYTYVPGTGTPQPVNDPTGHMFGIPESRPFPLHPDHWQESESYLYAVDLFNHGFYWEAHEAWESLWHAAGHHGIVADFLKGLIKLAAAWKAIRRECGATWRERTNYLQQQRHELMLHTFAGSTYWKLQTAHYNPGMHGGT
jgi:hypothetical protein